MATCDVVTRLKASEILTNTSDELLELHVNDIMNCFGGIKKCLQILLKSIDTENATNLTKVMININNEQLENNQMKQKVKQNEIMDIGVSCIQNITNFLSIQEIGESFTLVCKSFGVIGMNEMRKVDFFFRNGHDFINKHLIVNTLGLGRRKFLNQCRMYKDSSFQDLFQKISDIIGIPQKHLSIWHYTERKNLTIRPNREIKLNSTKSNEKFWYKGLIKDEMKKMHTIPTHPVFKGIQSVYQRIGDIKTKKRMFIMFNKQKIQTIPRYFSEDDDIEDIQQILIGIKYFDIFTQNLYFVDWIYAVRHVATVQDISHYIKTHLICKNEKYFKKCQSYLKILKKFENECEAKHDTFCFYEEEKPNGVYKLENNDLITSDYYNGDIFVFQLNTNHPYFDDSSIGSFNVLHLTADRFMESLEESK